MHARWYALLAIAFLACGRDPMGISARDGAAPDRPRDLAAPDAAADIVPATDAADAPDATDVPDVADVPNVADGPALRGTADACVPLTCDDPTCFPAYCGEIGDGCGGVLRCGGCAAGWSCKGSQCFPDDCHPITCDNATLFPYCGAIGNGCGGTLRCTCPNLAWTCVGHICNGVASGCAPILGCVSSGGQEYCGGVIGDGCGGVLDCRRDCSRAGFVCRDRICVDTQDAGPPNGPVPPPTLPPPPPVPPPPPPPPCPAPPPPPAEG